MARDCLIQDHGIIGNMKSAALVGMDGVIDFYCYPEFDSPSVFACLLDEERGGHFALAPQMEVVRRKQIYVPMTNVLVTRLLGEDVVVEITDFLPVSGQPGDRANRIVRHVDVVKGEVTFKLRCAPRFDYGRAKHEATAEHESTVVFRPLGGGSEALPEMALRATVPLAVDGADAVAELRLARGESATFTFGGHLPEEEMGILDQEAYDTSFAETTGYWRRWLSRSTYKGRWREMVNRSALLLKLLSSHEHGSLIAAPTFGLPELPGGVRNWDYRYSWLRDSAFTLYAFLRLGFTEESLDFRRWMKDRIVEGLRDIDGQGPLKPFYPLFGAEFRDEETLAHLRGYQDSRPVRIGNGAMDQLQLDIYGELMDAMYLGAKYAEAMSHDGWSHVREMLAWLADNWRRPDEGIWEVRGGRQELLHSRLMCWVAFDRGIRLTDKRSLVAPLAEWIRIRNEIHEDIFDNFWDEELGSFVQSKGSKIVDASVLLMPLMRFIGPTDPRWLGTMKAIEENLSEGGLIYRYASGTDGLEGNEGTFTPCSFWFIECLARAGQVDKAHLLFERILGYANHLGLFSEELSSNGEQLGNFPQALTHLALISAATFLDRRLSGSHGETWQ
jgi:GH15 family glucan-1,4-alpha-glucosidase